MAETREKTKDTPGTASGMSEKAGDQGKASTQASKAKPLEATPGVVGAVKEKVEDMAAGASHIVGKVKDTAEEWASSVGGAAVQAKDKAQEVAGAAAEKVGEMGQGVTDLLRRYPIPALLISVGVGFILAQLLRGMRSATT
jgi:predicted phage tail protein